MDTAVDGVAAALESLRLPPFLRRSRVRSTWLAVAQEARALDEVPLRVLNRRHATLDARSAGVLGFAGFLIAGLGIVYALDLVRDPLVAAFAVASAICLLLGAGYGLRVMRVRADEPAADVPTAVALQAVELAFRTQQFRLALLLTELGGMAASLMAGALLSPFLGTAR